jgi:electron transport complex protein RnfD
MREVLLALSPGIGVWVILFGPAAIGQILLGIFGAVTAEALGLWIRKRPLASGLGDLSAVLTGTLLALSITPLAPAWIMLTGSALGILIGKHAYGGLGQNPFNPAMVGFALVMLAFPHWMTLWPGTVIDSPSGSLGFGNSWNALFGNHAWVADAVARATPLTARHDVWRGLSIAAPPLDGDTWGWFLLNVAYLGGGLWLIQRKRIDPRIPGGMLTAMMALSLLMITSGAADAASLWPTFFMGSTMIGAFFIATDPVSAATTVRGRWIFGACIGLTVVLIRRYGSYPDGMAFAVLMMNFAAPALDRLTRPRGLGH